MGKNQNITKTKYRYSYSQKIRDKKQWYKDFADLFHRRSTNSFVDINGIPYKDRIQVNYDLFNNILNLEELNYVCKPYGEVTGELPARMNNKDIVSPKIKAVIAMEGKLPWNFNVSAINPEATSRKEQYEFQKIRDYVINQITAPIREQAELKARQEAEGRELTPEEEQEILAQIEQEVETQTPQSVRKYMQREHQDPVEIMSTQLLNYLIKTLDIKKKFRDAFKHSLLSSTGCIFVGAVGDEVQAWTVNSKYFECDMNSNNENIEDGEWATCTYFMSPTKIVSLFSEDLKDSDIDKIYEAWAEGNYFSEDDLFAEAARSGKAEQMLNSGLPVVHCVWKALRKIGFLTYVDDYGNTLTKMVDEGYRLREDFGDIKIKWEYIPEVYETWKIMTGDPIYVGMRPLPGQSKDINNIHNCKLPYYGYRHDALNSVPTALMDRLKVFQYLYNIFWYRLEILLSSDKGKKLLMNIGAVPKKSGINIKQWQYFFDATPYAWVDPKEEGTDQYADINTVAKVLDMSLASDIQKYINLLEYIRNQAGQSVGISDSVEGQASPDQSIGLNRQNIAQSSNILESYFYAHASMKRNVLQALIECGKVVYSSKKEVLSYVLDDMSMEVFEIDGEMLDNSTLSVFVNDSTRHQEIKDLILQLSHAAMQNQTVEFSDIVAVSKHDSIAEAEEELRAAEDRRRNFNKELEDQNHKNAMEQMNRKEEMDQAAHERDKEIVILKEEVRRETILQQAALTGMSFNPEADRDRDGVNDFLEIAKQGLNADVAASKQQLEREEFEHKKEQDRIKNDQKSEEIKIARQKLGQGNSSKK